MLTPCTNNHCLRAVTRDLPAFLPLVMLAAPSPTSTPVPEEEEYYSSWSLFLVCLLLILSLWTSYYLQIKRIRAVHETGVSIIAGMVVGLVVRLAPGSMIKEMLTFKHTLFFNLLLPPIILNSGYELKQENFFRNFGSILTFAFLGTFISAVGVGILVYVYSFLGLESLEFGLVECLKFGSTLSATDPVTILAIFNQYKVDPKLYTVIFGESLLNDAVSIVMYETLTQFHGTEEIFISSIFKGIGIFLLSFSVSMALGVVFGLGMSLLLKHSALHLYPSIESCLVALCAYTCYFFSNGLSMSGIVSLLFCGITLKHYAYHTMSRRTQRATKYIFSTLAQISENFIFIYLGIALFTSAPTNERVTSYVKPIFITITTVAVIFTRYAAVFPLSEAINFFHRHVRGQRQEELPHSYQMMLFWAGLRGAVGVALAAGFTGENAPTLRMTVLVVVVLTVLLFGGTTARMLEVLGIRTGVEDEAASSSDEEDHGPMRSGGRRGPGRWSRFVDEDPSYLARPFVGTRYAYNHHQQEQPYSTEHGNGATPTGGAAQAARGGVFSSASSDSYDSDGEVLPLATAAPAATGNGSAQTPRAPVAGEDGKWFQALDERYLLPLFSNATASRTFHARRARRTASGHAVGSAGVSAVGTPAGSDDEGGADVEFDDGEVELGVPLDQRRPRPQQIQTQGGAAGSLEESRMERGLASPMLRSNSSGERVDLEMR
ncbi:Sodium/hydrogen exchanger [Mycena indigotica]|uniref:Sodium/hydrogen exchanger n=1 Tax=Mycena indigotica TaxID=2126181 RepID=A0A8H6SJ28_9AGAR|nr:Sodium/hydrogen exchanger [Mycena indigotica]KAF7298765.1 Sodium/hydrogen exchanger [Mycena indigotica]